jgi:hypothetical protein
LALAEAGVGEEERKLITIELSSYFIMVAFFFFGCKLSKKLNITVLDGRV